MIVEPTSGNTGVGLAVVTAAKGYRLILTMPDNMSLERRALLKAYGAELHLTPAARGHAGRASTAPPRSCRDNPTAFMPQQFKNPANVEAHRRTTGPEILAQLGNRAPDAFVHGVGTGGTITGVGQVLRAKNPNVRIVAVEPEKSAVLSGGPAGEHRIDGIGAGFVPADPGPLGAQRGPRHLRGGRAAHEAGRSPAAKVCWSESRRAPRVKIALDVARELGPGKTVVTVLCDTGERYFSSDAYFE